MAARSYDVSVLPGDRIPGPYIAETMPVSVEQDYVVIDDSPVRKEAQS
jgi:hypothetical protein